MTRSLYCHVLCKLAKIPAAMFCSAVDLLAGMYLAVFADCADVQSAFMGLCKQAAGKQSMQCNMSIMCCKLQLKQFGQFQIFAVCVVICRDVYLARMREVRKAKGFSRSVISGKMALAIWM